MSYADVEYYKDTYGGTAIPDTEITKQLSRASDQIDSMTYNRIGARGFDSLTPYQRDKVKKAVCAQADFMYQYSPYLDLPVSGYTAGSISLTLKSGEAVKTTDEVLGLLKYTGLTDRRV